MKKGYLEFKHKGKNWKWDIEIDNDGYWNWTKDIIYNDNYRISAYDVKDIDDKNHYLYIYDKEDDEIYKIEFKIIEEKKWN